MKMTGCTATVLAALFASPAAFAQDTAMQAHESGSAMELPDACKMASPPGGMGMENMEAAMEGMGEHQREFMHGMMQTHDPMMQSMMAEDPDVAFACAMIPHHQGAINMADAELQHGDDEQMRHMAQKIIDAQKKEIAQLTQWIEEHAE